MGENKELAVETMKTACEYIDKVEKVIKELLENRYKQEFSQVINIMPSIVDGVEWLTDVINLTLEHQRKPFDIQEFNGLFAQIIEAMEGKDEGLVYDIFEYEFLPILQKCKMNFVCDSNYVS